MDPVLASDGKTPYAVVRFREIAHERYRLSKIMHTSYLELGKITPIERQYLIDFAIEDAKKEDEMVKEATRSRK